MKTCDYPLLYQISDKGSVQAQKKHLNMIKVQFLMLILAAVLSNIEVGQSLWTRILSRGTSVLLFVALILRIVTERIGFDKKWFVSRAIAESVKNITWRYMTRTAPYEGEPNSEEIDRQFLSDIEEIHDRHLEGAQHPANQTTLGSDITQHMRDVRSMSLAQRRCCYNEERVKDQKQWYSRKARMNEKSRSLWFWSSLGVESVAVVLAFLLADTSPFLINPVWILITVAPIIVAWTHIKRHRELSQSYSVVAHELARISAMYLHVDSEEKLSDYVANTENVISKEHTRWLVRRKQ